VIGCDIPGKGGLAEGSEDGRGREEMRGHDRLVSGQAWLSLCT
jgi:hypothetical protein